MFDLFCGVARTPLPSLSDIADHPPPPMPPLVLLPCVQHLPLSKFRGPTNPPELKQVARPRERLPAPQVIPALRHPLPLAPRRRQQPMQPQRHGGGSRVAQPVAALQANRRTRRRQPTPGAMHEEAQNPRGSTPVPHETPQELTGPPDRRLKGGLGARRGR